MSSEQYHLASCDSVERREAAAKVMAMLSYIPRTDTARFETEDSNDSDASSDIPDPFSDDDDCEQLRKFSQRRTVYLI